MKRKGHQVPLTDDAIAGEIDCGFIRIEYEQITEREGGGAFGNMKFKCLICEEIYNAKKDNTAYRKKTS